MVGWLVKLVLHRVFFEEVLAGTEIPGDRGRSALYLTLTVTMSVLRSHFNVSLIVTGKVKRQCPYPQLFEKRAELNQGPSAYQPNALPRGQTGSNHP